MEILLICFTAWAVAQATKVTIGLIKEKRIDWSYFVGTGGMPSSHSATVCALAASLGIAYGFTSPYFDIATILALIVMYDAAGVRRAVSRQSVILNRITRELREQRPIGEVEKDLRELWGHSPFQVFIGAFIGAFIAWLWLFLSK
jgi:acid phosphatase family membrane protein YuiD